MTHKPMVVTADDNEDVREIVRIHLERAGYDVTEAVDGEHVISVTKDAHPDVILLDVDMPRVNGHQVLEELKADPSTRDIPVVLLTSHDSVEDIVSGLSLGAHDHLAKPFAAGELLARTNAALRVKQLQDQLYERNEQLEVTARTDPLTTLPNRRHFDEQLAALASSANRHATALSAVLIDIDHFKNVNDEYGHPVGDEVLREVAKRIAASLRIGDVAARWGGEEFIVALPVTDLAGAQRFAERVRAIISQSPVTVGEFIALDITASFGVSCGTDVQELVSSADSALYEAKAAGRNRVESAT